MKDNRVEIRKPARRRERLACEALEDRVVLSDWGGGTLLQGLASVGILAGSVDAGGADGFLGGRSGGDRHGALDQNSQLATDSQKLQTDLAAIAAKSGVTVADLTKLKSDGKAIAQAGFTIDSQALQKVTGELATAVASGADTTQAKGDFNALFASSSVAQTAIDKAFTDMVQTIQDSKITAADLTAIAADQAAVKKDLASLGGGHGTYGGDSLLASLATLGVVPGGGGFSGGGPMGFGSGGPREFGGGLPINSRGGGPMGLRSGHQGGFASGEQGDWGQPSPLSSQLQTDLQKLHTDLQAITAKSGVTAADLANLQADGQALTSAGFEVDRQALQKVTAELATAVASGGDTTQAKTDFNGLFTGSGIAQTAIDKAFADVVGTTQDSKVTTTDLTTIANDRAAIQKDMPSPPANGSAASSSGSQTVATATAATSSSGAASSSGSNTGSAATTTPATASTVATHAHGSMRHRIVRAGRHRRR